MANRLALVEPSAADGERPGLSSAGAQPPARRTGLLLAQRLGLLFQTGLQGAFGQARGRGLGDLLHGVQIDIDRRRIQLQCIHDGHSR